MTPDLSATRTAVPEARPAASDADFMAPDTIAGRYDLLECIGRGGMGRVFRAYDKSLKRHVAIKVLAPDLAAHPSFSQHMMREARAVAQLQHPGIASVYDVVEDAGALYLVMELLRGETLANRLRTRPLTLRQSIQYGCLVADALAHAHAQGIVHCDLKPGNIFLTEGDEAIKVVDFGLARAVNRTTDGLATDGIGASATLIEGCGGTPAYMAPEQKRGLPLDHRADIYSFGVVLQEMFSGAIPGLSGAASTARAADASPRSGTALPLASLTPILRRTQEGDPAERFQSIEDVKAALQQVPAEGSIRSRWRGRSGVVAAALILLVGALLFALMPRGTGVGSGTSIPVLGVPRFVSSSTEPSMAFLAAGLSDMVAAELGTASVVAASGAAVRAPDEAAAVARELGAGALVLGKVDRNDRQVTVGVRLYTAGNGSFTPGVDFTRSAEDLLGIQRALAATVRTQLAAAGVTIRAADRQASARTERLLPSTMTSFEEYAQARGYLERSDVGANVDYALGILNGIVAREPDFALARATLGEATWRKWQATKDPEWSKAALGHALEALRLSTDLPEVRYAVALVYQSTGRRADALAELEQVAVRRPFNDDVQRLMGRLYVESGRVDEGFRALDRAIALRPAYWGNHAALGNMAYRVGRYDRAIAAFGRFRDLRPDSASAHQRLGTAYHAAGNLEAALESYESALKISPNANAYSNVGTLQFDAGRYGPAAKAYARASELDPRNASLHRNLADALRRLGDSRGAGRAYGRVIALATDALRVNPNDASTLSLKAVALARTGRLPESDTTSSLAVKLEPNDNDVLYERGLVLAMLGRQADAVDALKRAVAAGYSAKRLRTDPDLAGLAKLPAFIQLLDQQAVRKGGGLNDEAK